MVGDAVARAAGGWPGCVAAGGALTLREGAPLRPVPERSLVAIAAVAGQDRDTGQGALRQGRRRLG